MKVLDSGHTYALKELDSNSEFLLVFVKREGVGYPGNVGHHPGVNIQEVLRALIDRFQYLENQIPDPGNLRSIHYLRETLRQLEIMAAKRHGRKEPLFLDEIEEMDFCSTCGHIGCTGKCHPLMESHQT